MSAIPSERELPDVAVPRCLKLRDVFSITGRGTVATGRVERGGEGFRYRRDRRPAWISRAAPSLPASRCSGKLLDEAQAATTSACFCAASSAQRGRERGRVLAKPGSIHFAHPLHDSGFTF